MTFTSLTQVSELHNPETLYPLNVVITHCVLFSAVKVSEYPLVDGHHSMQIYMNAMKQCFLTLKRKQGSAYRDTREPQLDDFSYFAFHTPFSKMV